MDAFSYIKENGIAHGSGYRRTYLQNKRNCGQHRKQLFIFIREYHLLLPNDQEKLKVAVSTIGPASISIKFTENCFLYKTGIFMTTFVKTTTRSQLIPCYLWAIFFEFSLPVKVLFFFGFFGTERIFENLKWFPSFSFSALSKFSLV